MQTAGIDDDVELPGRGPSEEVCVHQVNLCAFRFGMRLGHCNRPWNVVQSGHYVPLLRQPDREHAGATTQIERSSRLAPPAPRPDDFRKEAIRSVPVPGKVLRGPGPLVEHFLCPSY